MVEFAVCLPVIMMIVLAAIEACSVIFLRQALQATAYEAVRAAVAPTATTAAVLSRANDMLRQRHVQQGSIQLSPSDPTAARVGSQIQVTVTAPIDSNRLMPPWFFGSGNLTVNCVMLKEGNAVVRVANGSPSNSLLAFLTFRLGP